ncbi:F-box/kelch-repeat protein [Dorcoceras hygrometricum]|uniref:F-box/kelch-repeat protein n=1 Tax=Dorcoceras hygrometricum TaxID=472368 RepID=A0A2Z7ASN7_9LAMI|nr:F-box/kelch-repeat protein [Dorcoceras hygrometricum]
MADSAAVSVKNARSFEEVWPILQVECINKLIHSLDHEGPRHSQIFTSDDYMRFYTLVFEVCHPNPLVPGIRKMYDQYENTFHDYICSKVLPSLRGKENQDLLKELLKQWTNYRILARWLSRFFFYLDRYFIPKAKLPSLTGTSHLAFYNLVYGEINGQVTDAILSLIHKEREGEQIDRTLVKEILDIYVVMGEDSLKYYKKDFEELMVSATAVFYSRKALDWISNMSYESYMLEVEDRLKQEESRVSSYMRYQTKYKLSEVRSLLSHPIIDIIPAKSVGKCRCVSKSWKDLLYSPEFISKTHQENLILISSSHSLHTIPTAQMDGFSKNIELFPDTSAEIFVGSFNGLVLLTNEEGDKFLVNPTTLQKVRVPNSPLALYRPGSFNMHGFGYDSSSHDYKVVALSYFNTDNEYEPDCADTFVDVYSVRSGVWKRLDSSPYDHAVPDLASGAFVNGAIHWLASSKERGLRSVIAAFDLVREVFDEIPAPSSVDVERFVFHKLVVLGGCLCMVDSIGSDGIDVWIMKEYGLADSWTKFSINGDSGVDVVKPLCYVGDGEVVFLTEEESLVVYDPISETFRDMIVDGVPANILDGGTFVESLVSPVFSNHV